MTNKSKNVTKEVSERISEIMRIVGSIKSEKKAKASRENGKLGGRPINPKSKRQLKLKKKDLKCTTLLKNSSKTSKLTTKST
jgi:uncharacterized protein YwqG